MAPADSAYLHLENLLPAEQVSALIDFVRSNEAQLQPSGVLAAPGDEHVEVRRSKTLFALDEIWPFFEQQLHGLLPTIRKELGIPWFQLHHVERQLTVHEDGDFFGLHNDSGGPQVATRALTWVYYFNCEPKGFEGGALRIYDSVERDGILYAGDDFIELEPTSNSVIFFPPWVHHEVLPVRSAASGLEGCRMTVNGWFHTEASVAETPAEEESAP